MNAHALGQRVAFRWSDVLTRDSLPNRRNARYWVKHPRFWPSSQDRVQEGIVYGLRTLTNGTVEAVTEWDWYSMFSSVVATSYQVEESFQAVLIAWDVRRKPVVVALADVMEVTSVRGEAMTGRSSWSVECLRARVTALPAVEVDFDPDPHGKPIVRQAVLLADVLALLEVSE